MTSQLAVCGGSGFIGRHLTHALANDRDVQVRMLVHRHSPSESSNASNVVSVSGDLSRTDSLAALLAAGCTVVNLAYLPAASRAANLAAIANLAEASRIAKVKRLVHVSTATVVGAAADEVVTEATSPVPRTDYERTKLEVEQLLAAEARNAYELVILRPTAVFGPGGKNLVKLAAGLLRGNKLESYVRSCVHGRRKLNLVCVDNVVAAIRFAARAGLADPLQIFIVSDDDEELNNYRDVELMLMDRFGRADYAVSPLAVPPIALRMLLRFAGRSNVNPDRVYSNRKLSDAGFKKTTSFAAGLACFADWFSQARAG